MGWAAKGGNEDIVNEMIRLGANDFTDMFGEALQGGNPNIVRLFLQHGADPTDYEFNAGESGSMAIIDMLDEIFPNPDYEMVLYGAASIGNRDIVYRILGMAEESSQLIGYVIPSGNIDLLTELLDTGKYPIDKSDVSAAIQACKPDMLALLGQHTDILKFHINYSHLLTLVCKKKCIPMIMYCLKQGGRPKTQFITSLSQLGYVDIIILLSKETGDTSIIPTAVTGLRDYAFYRKSRYLEDNYL